MRAGVGKFGEELGASATSLASDWSAPVISTTEALVALCRLSTGPAQSKVAEEAFISHPSAWSGNKHRTHRTRC